MPLCDVCGDYGDKLDARPHATTDGRVLRFCSACYSYFEDRGLLDHERDAEIYGYGGGDP